MRRLGLRRRSRVGLRYRSLQRVKDLTDSEFKQIVQGTAEYILPLVAAVEGIARHDISVSSLVNKITRYASNDVFDERRTDQVIVGLLIAAYKAYPKFGKVYNNLDYSDAVINEIMYDFV